VPLLSIPARPDRRTFPKPEKEAKSMAEHGKSRETSAPADKVWGIWTDTSTWGRWNPNVTTMEMPPPVALGKTGVMNTPAGQHHQMKVIGFQPGRSFTLETSVIPLSRFQFTCSVEPAGGKTRIQQTVKVVGPMGWLFDPMMGGQIANDFDKVLDGLAKEAEGSA
jgi:uncharacterized protein YndB with AHSA1/START domain